MLPADGMVSASDGVLDVAEQSIDPVELRVCHAGTSSASDVVLMNVGGGIEGSEAFEAVADDLVARRNGLLGVATYLGKGKAAHTAS